MAMNRVISSEAERDIEILAQIEELRKRLAEVSTELEGLRQRVPPAPEKPREA